MLVSNLIFSYAWYIFKIVFGIISMQLPSKQNSATAITLLSILLVCFTFTSLAHSRTLEVGVYENRPMIFMKEGKPRGIYIEVLQEIAQRKGWDIDYQGLKWEEAFSRLKRKKIDLLPVVAYKKSRDKFLDFAEETLLTNWGQVYTRSNLDIDSIQSLQGKRIGLQPKDTHAGHFSELFAKFNITFQKASLSQYKDIFRQLEKGEIDAGVVNRLFAAKHENNYNVKRTPIVFNPIQMRFAVPEGDPKGILFAWFIHLQ